MPDIVYNLKEYAKELYLPEAWIVVRDKQGHLTHIQQRASAATIGAFRLEMDDSRKKLFTIIDELQEEKIIRYFHKGKRKPPDLKTMMEDRTLAKAIQNYVHRRINILLQEVVQQQLPLSWKAKRRTSVKNYIVDTNIAQLKPHFHFRKTEDAVFYRLNLEENETPWPIQNRNIAVLTNLAPGWIIADHKLYQLAHINGFLIKPFRQKEVVVIPSDYVNTYFRNFIMKIINKVNIDTEGFELKLINQLTKCVLEPVQDIFNNHWILAVQMVYNDVTFGWNERRESHSRLEIKAEEIHISKVARNWKEEKIYIEKLKKFPLFIPKDRQQFEVVDETNNPYALLEWISDHQKELAAAGFDIISPVIGGKKLLLDTPSINMNMERDLDWFDLKGEITVGEYRFPFIDLVTYIRDKNRFYPLPNGHYFLIPEEWLARYKNLADFGKKEGKKWRIAKSQYTLLEGIKLKKGTKSEDEVPVFNPSPLLNAQLRPYQLEGARWLANLYHQQLGACLADDMGLGKTLQTIAILLYAKERKAARYKEQKKTGSPTGKQLALFAVAEDIHFLQPLQALIVLPSSLLFNWESELKKFAPSLSIYHHYAAKRHKDPRIIARFDVVLTTYQTALRDAEILKNLDFEYIVLDESQQIKNRESKVFKALNTLNAQHKISLSGTPIENSLSDLWSQMQFINEGLLGSYGFFKKSFVTPIEKGQDEGKKAQLRQLVAPYLLRRTKGQVAKDLPALTRRVFFTEMTPDQRKIYEREKSAARNHLLDNFDAKNGQYRLLVIQTLTRLRQLVNHPVITDPDYTKGSGKFKDILEQWEIVRQSGHKVLMFSSFVRHLALFKAEMEQRQAAYAWLSGAMSPQKRKKEIERFQHQADVQSFLISIKTGGTGLNLTAAEYVFILDPWWNPTVEQQAIARAHRIGQKNNVIALKFITRNSIEEKILSLQERKLQLSEDIIGSGDKISLDKEEIAFLLD